MPRAACADAATEEAVETVWAGKLAANPRMFDASKFRMVGAETTDDGVLLLSMGITSYKEYIGTNLQPEPDLSALIGRG